MTPLRPSVDYRPLAPLRLDGLQRGRITGAPPARFLLRGVLVAAVLALPALGTWVATPPQRPPVSGATQIAAILGPSPMGVAGMGVATMGVATMGVATMGVATMGVAAIRLR